MPGASTKRNHVPREADPVPHPHPTRHHGRQSMTASRSRDTSSVVWAEDNANRKNRSAGPWE